MSNSTIVLLNAVKTLLAPWSYILGRRVQWIKINFEMSYIQDVTFKTVELLLSKTDDL